MNKPRIHLICNAHLDPVWQWRWEEGCAETLSTFRTAVQLVHEYPDFIFNHNEAILYQWTLKYDPGLFTEIQQLVKAGRWFISGGWYLQPDVNLPGTESIIRHIAEGRRFFKEHFGVQPRVAYNFDSFGHSGGLPQILSQAGYKMYIHLRPQSSELELPSDLYRWRGVDGSEIIGYRIAVGLYHTEYDNIEQRLTQGVELALKLNRDVPVFWGIGNHGGGATRADLEKIAKFQQQQKRVEIIHSTTDQFYEAVKDAAEYAPLVEGDLQRIFTGCYTSLSRIKRTAQKSLHRLVQAETLRAATWWLFAQEYPQQQLAAAWRDHLFNDFHDILPGSCIEPAERDAQDLYGKVAETIRRLRLGAAVAFNSGTKKEYDIPITILNSFPHGSYGSFESQSVNQVNQNQNQKSTMVTRKLPVEVECMISHRPKWSGVWHLRLFNSNGVEIPCQEEQPEALLPFNGWRRKVSFMADLPDVGAAHYHLKLVEGKRTIVSTKPALNFQFDRQTGLIDKLNRDNGGECLAGLLMQPIVVKDEGDSWGTDCWAYRNVVGKFLLEQGSFQVIETGPIRIIYQSAFTFNHSRMVMDTIGYADFPIIEYRLRVFWNEERQRLKLSIPTAFKNDHLICEVPGGIISRPADGEEQVHGRWFMLENDQNRAIGVANSGQHGLDFKEGEVRLSVLRSAAYCHEQGFKLSNYPARRYMDQGVHDVRLLVTVGEADSVRRALPAMANWLNAPPITYAHLPIGSFSANLNSNRSQFSQAGVKNLLSIEPQNISLLAGKRSGDEKALILRLQESCGMKTEATIQLTKPDILIESIFQPLEIKTLRIERSGRWAEVNMIEEDK